MITPKNMHFKSASYLLILLILTCHNTMADSIKLKDGTVLEGKILEETPDSIKIEYNLTKSIKDIKIVKRSDTLEISKEAEDEKALKKLTTILPTADLITIEGYDELLNGHLADFIRDFPSSNLKSKVQDIIDELQKEKKLVESGNIKLNGKWISPDEAAKDNYNHSAKVVLARMQVMLKKGRFAEALDNFEILQKEYAYSIAYDESIPVTLGLLPKYDIILAREEKAFEIRNKEREEQYKSMEADDKLRTEQAFQSAMKKFQEKVTEAKEIKKVWLPINKWDLKSIKDARQTIVKETKTLESLNLSVNKITSKALSEAYQSYSSGDLENAKSQLGTAKTNGARGKSIDELSSKIESAIKEKIETERAAAIAAAAITKKEKEESEQKAKEQEALKNKPLPTTSKNTDLENSKTETAPESSGISLQTIIIIIALLLAVSTVCAKLFFKPQDEGTDFAESDSED